MTVPELAQLALDLRLTAKQRAFAEALILDGTGNASAAARKVNPEGKNPDVTGSKWLALSKVQRYIEAFRETALARASNKGIINLERTLEILSEQAEGKAPTKVIRKFMKTVQDGEVEWTPGREKHFDRQKAASTLMQHYKPQDKGSDNRKLVLIQLGDAPPQRLMDAVAGLLEHGSE